MHASLNINDNFHQHLRKTAKNVTKNKDTIWFPHNDQSILYSSIY